MKRAILFFCAYYLIKKSYPQGIDYAIDTCNISHVETMKGTDMNPTLAIILIISFMLTALAFAEHDSTKGYEQCMAKGSYSHQTCWLYSR